MADTFKAEERKIREILSKRVQYSIPRNQRDYTWDENQLKEFWYDITETIELDNTKNNFVSEEYFIGSCVLQNINNKEISILDGQQRFTTIMILLSLLCRIFKKLDDDERLWKGLYQYIQTQDDDGNDFFIFSNQNIHPFLEESILYIGDDQSPIAATSEQEKKIEYAYNFFSEQFEKIIADYSDRAEDFLKELRNQILNLKIVEISVENEIDGYMIFEILNARGKQLELQDLIKNWVLKKLSKTFPSDRAKAKWNKIQNNIEDISSSDNSFKIFLTHYWISTYQKLKEEEIYHYFKREVRSAKMLEFLNDLEEKSIIYAKIAKPNSIENLKIRNILKSFIIFRTTQVKPMILSLWHNLDLGRINEKTFINHLKQIEKFHFIFTAICSERSNLIESLYYDYSPKIRSNYSKGLFNEFLMKLCDKLPNYSKFEAFFLQKGYSQKDKKARRQRKLIRYIIETIENYFNQTDEIVINNYSIEHILNDDSLNENSHKIGNLLPLDRNINGNIGDREFSEKLNFYQQSEFKVVKNFITNYSEIDWNNDTIIKRTKKLAKLSYFKIWKIK